MSLWQKCLEKFSQHEELIISLILVTAGFPWEKSPDFSSGNITWFFHWENDLIFTCEKWSDLYKGKVTKFLHERVTWFYIGIAGKVIWFCRGKSMISLGQWVLQSTMHAQSCSHLSLLNNFQTLIKQSRTAVKPATVSQIQQLTQPTLGLSVLFKQSKLDLKWFTLPRTLMLCLNSSLTGSFWLTRWTFPSGPAMSPRSSWWSTKGSNTPATGLSVRHSTGPLMWARLSPSAVNGSLSPSAVNGSLSLSAVNGSLSPSAVNGSLSLSAVNGNLSLSTVNGSLSLSAVNGSVSLLAADVSFVRSALDLSGSVCHWSGGFCLPLWHVFLFRAK